MLEIKWTKRMKKDLKKYKHQRDVSGALQEIILLLINKKPLPALNLDHPLTSNWVNHRECHAKSDVLLIYKTNDQFLYLSRLGSHSEHF
jgi:mRNA interferase YafQ